MLVCQTYLIDIVTKTKVGHHIHGKSHMIYIYILQFEPRTITILDFLYSKPLTI